MSDGGWCHVMCRSVWMEERPSLYAETKTVYHTYVAQGRGQGVWCCILQRVSRWRYIRANKKTIRTWQDTRSPPVVAGGWQGSNYHREAHQPSPKKATTLAYIRRTVPRRNWVDLSLHSPLVASEQCMDAIPRPELTWCCSAVIRRRQHDCCRALWNVRASQVSSGQVSRLAKCEWSHALHRRADGML